MHRLLILLLAPALAGCLAAEDVAPASLPPLDGLILLGSTNVTRAEITGSVGLGVNGAMLPGAYDEQVFEVPAGALFVRANLTWTTKGPDAERSDLDFQIRDAKGRVVAQGASLSDVESAGFRVTPRIELPVTFRVVSYTSPPTDYKIEIEVVTA